MNYLKGVLQEKYERLKALLKKNIMMKYQHFHTEVFLLKKEIRMNM